MYLAIKCASLSAKYFMKMYALLVFTAYPWRFRFGWQTSLCSPFLFVSNVNKLL